MRRGRAVVGVLGGVAAGFAMLVGAVSLTRIAGGYLGFPPGLEWTFTGAVDVAGIAGGIMWTAFTGSVRKIGRPMNVVCTLVSGVGVGLDHATHAPPGVWQKVAFIAGVFVPLLATWILHALSIIADTSRAQPPATTLATRTSPAPAVSARHQSDTSEHQTTRVLLGTSTPGDAHQALIATPPAAAQAPAVTPAPARPRTAVAAASKRPASVSTRALEAVPLPRPEWLTDEQLAAVLKAMRAARAARESYGRGRVMDEHDLNDPKAKALVRYIREHRLLEVAS